MPCREDRHSRQGLAGRSEMGFSLVEMLVALIILVLMTGIVAMGIPMAKSTYEKAVLASNAQALMSTTTIELRNELGLAQGVKTDAAGKVNYYISGEGYFANIENSNIDDPNIEDSEKTHGLVKNVFGTSSTATEIQPDTSSKKSFPLVNEKAITNELYVEFGDEGITYDASSKTFTVHELKVKSTGGLELAKAGSESSDGDFVIRAVMIDDE